MHVKYQGFMLFSILYCNVAVVALLMLLSGLSSLVPQAIMDHPVKEREKVTCHCSARA